jgi:hypothetical protein
MGSYTFHNQIVWGLLNLSNDIGQYMFQNMSLQLVFGVLVYELLVLQTNEMNYFVYVFILVSFHDKFIVGSYDYKVYSVEW